MHRHVDGHAPLELELLHDFNGTYGRVEQQTD